MDPTTQFLRTIGAIAMTRIALSANETPHVDPENYLLTKMAELDNNPMRAVNHILERYIELGNNIIFRNLYGRNGYAGYTREQLQRMGQIFLNRVGAPEFVSLLLNLPDAAGRNIGVAVQRLEERLVQYNMDSLRLFNDMITDYRNTVVIPAYNRIYLPGQEQAYAGQEQADAGEEPGPCQVGQYNPPRAYVIGNPIAPRTHGDCRNCDGEDPIMIEPIQSIPVNELIVLPSGNCMRRTHVEGLAPDERGRRFDPISRELIGGKKRKFRKTRRKTKKSKKQKKTRKMRKSRKSRKAKKQTKKTKKN